MGRPPKVTRAELLAAARKAFAERGFEGTTLAAIGAEVGITAAAVLRHAESKDALFRAAFEGAAGEASFPPEFLLGIADDADPRQVLRTLADLMLPFLEQKLGEHVAVWQRGTGEGRPPFLQFDPKSPNSPPKRGLGILADYFRRATRAGRLRVADPRAAALSFAGGLQAYVLFHRIAGVFEGALTKDRYIETHLDLWLHGAATAATPASAASAMSPSPPTPKTPPKRRSDRSDRSNRSTR